MIGHFKHVNFYGLTTEKKNVYTPLMCPLRAGFVSQKCLLYELLELCSKLLRDRIICGRFSYRGSYFVSVLFFFSNKLKDTRVTY